MRVVRFDVDAARVALGRGRGAAALPLRARQISLTRGVAIPAVGVVRSDVHAHAVAQLFVLAAAALAFDAGLPLDAGRVAVPAVERIVLEVMRARFPEHLEHGGGQRLTVESETVPTGGRLSFGR